MILLMELIRQFRSLSFFILMHRKNAYLAICQDKNMLVLNKNVLFIVSKVGTKSPFVLLWVNMLALWYHVRIVRALRVSAPKTC